jgi:nitrate reductase NapAB chaperone NapD
MPILGMVLVLDDSEPATRRAVARALLDAPDLELGEPADHRWPAVLEAPDPRRAESRIDSLRAIPGIADVDVVYADLEDLLEPPPSADALEES